MPPVDERIKPEQQDEDGLVMGCVILHSSQVKATSYNCYIASCDNLAQVTLAVSSFCQSEPTSTSQEEAVASTQEFLSSFTTFSHDLHSDHEHEHVSHLPHQVISRGGEDPSLKLVSNIDSIVQEC